MISTLHPPEEMERLKPSSPVSFSGSCYSLSQRPRGRGRSWGKDIDKKTERDKGQGGGGLRCERGTSKFLHSFYGYLWASNISQGMCSWEKRVPALQELT